MMLKMSFLMGDLSEEIYMQPPFSLFHPQTRTVNSFVHFIVLSKVIVLGLVSSAPWFLI